jgi:hypothetical protein
MASGEVARMKLGILADIHERSDLLGTAIGLLQDLDCERLIVLGDIFEMGANVAETVRILVAAGATGVYGNHDLALCHEPSPEVVARYPEDVTRYFASLGPRLAIEDLLFTHGAPWWDPTNPVDYYLFDPPHQCDQLRRHFQETFRASFIGHFHRWELSDSHGPITWNGEQPIELAASERYFVTVHAVQNGWCALFDTASGRLTPLRIL